MLPFLSVHFQKSLVLPFIYSLSTCPRNRGKTTASCIPICGRPCRSRTSWRATCVWSRSSLTGCPKPCLKARKCPRTI